MGEGFLTVLQNGDLETALAAPRSGDIPIPLVSSRYYNWAVAAPMVLSLQAFQRNIPEVSGMTHLLLALLSRAQMRRGAVRSQAARLGQSWATLLSPEVWVAFRCMWVPLKSVCKGWPVLGLLAVWEGWDCISLF